MTLLRRAYNVCSSYSNLNNEFNFVTTFFKNNGFPLHLIQNKIKNFLEAKYNTPVNINDDEIRNFYFSMPYFGSQSEKMRIELCNLLKQYFPSIKFNIILVNHHTIGSLFKHKDTLNKGMRSAVAYIYQCPKCGAQYVGSTIRNLSTRAAEHAGVSVRTGLPLSQPCQSHIRDHVISCNSNQISLDHFSIIGTNSNICELRILESLHIFQIKPQLNSMQSAYPLSIVR